MPDAAPRHPAALAEDELLQQCEIRRTRRSGPGGQHRNKVETAVIMTHLPTGIAAEASERRSQNENQRKALFRLRLKLALAVRLDPAQVLDAPASARWQARVRGGRLSINSEHEDFPALLAEALDVLQAQSYELAAAAAQLGASNSQLVNLLRREPAALVLLNTQRKRRGLQPLK